MDFSKDLSARIVKRGEKEPEYVDLFHPVTTEARKSINEKVLSAYTEKVKEQAAEKGSAAPAHKPQKPAPER